MGKNDFFMIRFDVLLTEFVHNPVHLQIVQSNLQMNPIISFFCHDIPL